LYQDIVFRQKSLFFDVLWRLRANFDWDGSNENSIVGQRANFARLLFGLSRGAEIPLKFQEMSGLLGKKSFFDEQRIFPGFCGCKTEYF
jgi:hypothetical protein